MKGQNSTRERLGRRFAFVCLVFCINFFSTTPSHTRPVQSSPNLVLVITDDQGYGDLGFTGNPIIKTPHLDTLARESIWL
ncbi:MAG: sulfatase-like hydrolase/transferase, partial [Verrucomicrobiota bacterium]